MDPWFISPLVKGQMCSDLRLDMHNVVWNARQKWVVHLNYLTVSCLVWADTVILLRRNYFNTWLRFAKGIFTFHPLCGACRSLNPAKLYWKVSQFYPADVKIGRREVIFFFISDKTESLLHNPLCSWKGLRPKPVISASHNFTKVNMKDQLPV